MTAPSPGRVRKFFFRKYFDLKTENISGYTCSSRANTLSSQLRDVVGQTEDEESSFGYDSLDMDGVNSLSNPTYSGHSIHSRYAAALNSSDTKYNSEVRVRPELSLFVFFLFFSFSEKLLRREAA